MKSSPTGIERIEGVAMRKAGWPDAISMQPPARHHDLIRELTKMGYDAHGAEQGFVTSTGRFVCRIEALEIARCAGQIVRRCGGDEHELFSENLW